MNPARRLIVNADDFGLSPGINRGIVEGFREGVLTSTTLMATMPAFDEAVDLALGEPGLGVGVHLTLLWGRPLSDPGTVRSLVEGDGRFPDGLATIASRYFLGRLSRDEVRRELTAQVRRVIESGIAPTHLDTHKHVHCLPGILDQVLAVAREFNVPHVRIPLELPRLGSRDPERPAISRKSAAKRDLIRVLARGARLRCERAGVTTTDRFVGIGHMDDLGADVLEFLIRGLEPGVTELMCHPGYRDEGARAYGSVPPHRERELAALCDPRVRARVEAEGVELTSFRELR